jgi:hypothetical protein
MAQHLPTDLALSPSNDLTLEKGDIAHSPSGRHRTEHQRAKRIPYLAGARVSEKPLSSVPPRVLCQKNGQSILGQCLYENRIEEQLVHFFSSRCVS